MNVNDVVNGGVINAENIGEVVKTAKSIFAETSHETSKGEGRANIYNFFKSQFDSIKETLTIPNEKGDTKPKYAVLKKFLIGEKIFTDNDHYNRAMVSINNHNRGLAKLAKLKDAQAVKAELDARIEACDGDIEKIADIKREQFILEAGQEAEQATEKREGARQAVLKNVKALTNIDNLRKLHREDMAEINQLLTTVKSFIAENVQSDTE